MWRCGATDTTSPCPASWALHDASVFEQLNLHDAATLHLLVERPEATRHPPGATMASCGYRLTKLQNYLLNHLDEQNNHAMQSHPHRPSLPQVPRPETLLSRRIDGTDPHPPTGTSTYRAADTPGCPPPQPAVDAARRSGPGAHCNAFRTYRAKRSGTL